MIYDINNKCLECAEAAKQVEIEESKFGYYVVRLPKNLRLGKHLQKHPLPKGLNNEKNPTKLLEDVQYVLGTISRVFTNNKNITVFTKEYANICSSILSTVVRDYKIILQWSVDTGLLETDNHYIPNEKCRGYRWAGKYATEYKVQRVELYGKKFQKAAKSNIDKQTRLQYPHLWRFYKDLEVNLEPVDEIIEKRRPKTMEDVKEKMLKETKYKGLTEEDFKKEQNHILLEREIHWKNALENLDEGFLCFKKDETVGRLHTNVSGLKRELRPLLSYKGERLIGCDMKNSQPALSVALLDPECWDKINLKKRILTHNKELRQSKFHTTQFNQVPDVLDDLWQGVVSKDVEDYRAAALNGGMYELMMDRYEKITDKSIDRDTIKTRYLSILFSPTYFNEQDKVYIQLRKEFPTVFQIFEWVNTGYKKFKNGVNGKMKRKPDEQSSALALLLQQLEAELILDNIVPLIKKQAPDVPLFTIHDSIVTTVGNEDLVKECMEQGSKQFLGFSPVIEIEYGKWLN